MSAPTLSADRAELLAPLSDAQRRLWYMAALEPGSAYYNVTIGCRLDGPLDGAALDAAVDDLVERHEILRTHYPHIGGEPFQRVAPAAGFRVHHVHRPIAAPGRAAAIDAFARRIATRRIDLAKGPVFEAHRLTLAPACGALVLLTHHIAIDQQSINTLMAELDACYAARAAGRLPSLPAVPSYRDFAAWHQGQVERRLPALRAYWRAHLAAAPAPLPLPPVSRSDGERGGLGAEQCFRLEGGDVERLRALCRETRSTPFMVLLTVFSALLHRYTGRSRFFVGTTTAFRGAREFAGTIGCFINTLAIPIEVAPDADLASLLDEVRHRAIDAFTRHDYSYERLVQLCREQHPGSPADFVNVYFQFQPQRLARSAAAHRFVPNVNVHNGRAKFPLMLNASDRGERIDCTFEFERDRFSAAEIRTLQDDFVAAVRLMIADGAAPVAAIRIGLDTAAWRGIEREALGPVVESEAALDETEAALAAIWLDLVETLPERRSESFAGLGGHSLLKAQLAWRIRKDLGVSVRLAELQRADTLAEMAMVVGAATGGPQQPVSRPAYDFESIAGLSCQVELGTWRRESIEALLAGRPGESMPARIARIAWAFAGTPFQFESRRPLPPPGRLPVRLGAFDCYTFVMTVLALASARSMEGFVRNLARLRYRDPAAIDSHPESGTIFDFAEEALLVNAVRLGLLRDVTGEVAGSWHRVATVLAPVRRDAAVDPAELWATPKLGAAPIAARVIEKADFGCFDRAGALRRGDVLLMSRSDPASGHIVDHLGFVDLKDDIPYLLQCTRHFARHDRPQPQGDGLHARVFYDSERRLEQIGVGIAGHYAGDGHTIQMMGTPLFGYDAGSKRPLRDYLDGAFSSAVVLRPVEPADAL